MKQPIVSVIVPAKDRFELLDRALQSVVLQTEDRFIVYVVDDGSKTPIRHHLQNLMRIDHRIQVLEYGRSMGGGYARQFAIERVCTPLVAFLDSDDIWSPEHLAVGVEHHEVNSFDHISYCSVRTITNHGMRSSETRPIGDAESPLSYACLVGAIQTSSIITTKSVAQAVRFKSIPRHQDLDFYIRSQKLGYKILRRSKPTVIWDLAHASGSVSRTPRYVATLDWIASVDSLVTKEDQCRFVYLFPLLEVIKARDGRALFQILGRYPIGLWIFNTKFVIKLIRSILVTSVLGVMGRYKTLR